MKDGCGSVAFLATVCLLHFPGTRMKEGCVGRLSILDTTQGCRMAVTLFLPVWIKAASCIQPLAKERMAATSVVELNPVNGPRRVGWLLLYSYLCRKEESSPCIQPLGVGWLLLFSYLCRKSLALIYSPWV
jgi:hypothetical protein